MKVLEDEGFIERKMIGNPARRWIKINFQKIEERIKSHENGKLKIRRDYEGEPR